MMKLTPQRKAPAKKSAAPPQVPGGRKRAGKSPGRGLLINVFSGGFFFGGIWGGILGGFWGPIYTQPTHIHYKTTPTVPNLRRSKALPTYHSHLRL